MKAENLECLRFTKYFNNESYSIFVIKQEYLKISGYEFFIRNDSYGTLQFNVGVPFENLSSIQEIEDFIDSLYQQWIRDYIKNYED